MEWREIDYNGLTIMVSDTGLIKTIGKWKAYSDGRIRYYEGHIVPQYQDRGGYMVCVITQDRKKYNIKVHRAVAMAFIPNPYNCGEVNHKDENKSNNCIDNLEWCTAKYNINYGTRNKRHQEKCGRQVICVETGEIYPSYNEARKIMGHPYSTCIRDCCIGRQKTAYGYTWKYIK